MAGIKSNETAEQKARRIAKDEETVYVMAQMYCKAHHTGAELDERGLCSECAEVVDYSIQRTRKCPNEHKGNCDACTIHCYAPQKRQQIRTIMAYAGPRMMTSHPIMAIRHLRKKIAQKNEAKRLARAAGSPKDN